MIRAYKHSDFSEIENIYNLSKKDEFAGESFDVAVTPLSKDQQMLALFHTSDVYVYEKKSIVGFVGVKDNYISWLFVHPDYRNQNVGKKLASHILSTLKGEVTLNVAGSNVIAIALYKKLGFEVVKEFSGKYQGNQIVVFKMANKTIHYKAAGARCINSKNL